MSRWDDEDDRVSWQAAALVLVIVATVLAVAWWMEVPS